MENSSTTTQFNAISSKAIVGRAIRQFGLTSYNILDGIELVYDAIEGIGFHLKKIHAVKFVDVENFVIQKPSNFVKLYKIKDLNGNEILKGLGKDKGYDWCDGKLTYTEREGQLELYYETTGVDEEGFPLVRDTFKYREAVRYFLLITFFEQGNKHPTLTLEYAQERFTHFRLRAKNEWKVTPEIVQQIKDKWDADGTGNLYHYSGYAETVRYTDRDDSEVPATFTSVAEEIQRNNET